MCKTINIMQVTQPDAVAGVASRLQNPALLRRLAAAPTANDAMDAFMQKAGEAGSLGTQEGFSEVQCLPASVCGFAWCMLHLGLWVMRALWPDRKSAGA